MVLVNEFILLEADSLGLVGHSHASSTSKCAAFRTLVHIHAPLLRVHIPLRLLPLEWMQNLRDRVIGEPAGSDNIAVKRLHRQAFFQDDLVLGCLHF